MELKQLEAFVSVAETGSFSGAARRMFLTQPTISTHIATLEKELGIRLFERTTKALNLTDDGKSLLIYAQRILELKNIMVEYSSRADGKIIHIGASTIPSGYLLPSVTGKFMEKNRDCCVRIKYGNSREIDDMVYDGIVSIGVIGRESVYSELVSEVLCPDEMVIAVPANERFERIIRSKTTRESRMAKLLKNPLILREDGSGTRQAVEKILESYENGGIIMRSNDQEAIKQMVAGGTGISLMSAYAARDMAEQGNILTFPIDLEAPRNFYIIYRHEDRLRPTEKRYLALLRKTYGK